MGSLSQIFWNGGGPRPRSNGSHTGPLRRILHRVDLGPGTAVQEALECGHYQLPKRDLMGETVAVRRRCRKCKRNAPKDFEPPAES